MFCGPASTKEWWFMTVLPPSVASSSITHHWWRRCRLRSRTEAFTPPPRELLLPFLKRHRRYLCQNTNSENLKCLFLCASLNTTLFLWCQMGNYRRTGFCFFLQRAAAHATATSLSPAVRSSPATLSLSSSSKVEGHHAGVSRFTEAAANELQLREHKCFILSQHHRRRLRSFSTVGNNAATHKGI